MSSGMFFFEGIRALLGLCSMFYFCNCRLCSWEYCWVHSVRSHGKQMGIRRNKNWHRCRLCGFSIAKVLPSINFDRGGEAVTRTISILQSSSFFEGRFRSNKENARDCDDLHEQVADANIVSSRYEKRLLEAGRGLEWTESVLFPEVLVRTLQSKHQLARRVDAFMFYADCCDEWTCDRELWAVRNAVLFAISVM